MNVRREQGVLLVLLGVVVVIVSDARTPLGLFDVACGILLLGVAVVAREKSDKALTPSLWAITGCVWLAGTIWPAISTWHRGPLVHVLLAYPTGRLDTPWQRLVVGLTYSSAVFAPTSEPVTAGTAVAVALTASWTWSRTTGRDHRSRMVGVVGAIVHSVVLAFSALQSALDWQLDRAVLLVYLVVLGGIAIAAIVDQARGRWTRAAVAGLVIDVGRSGDVGLEDAIRRAVGDPSLLVGFWVPDQAAYVTASGDPMDLAVEPGRRVTTVDNGGEKVAVLIHDPVTFDDPALLDGVAAAARLARSNARLQAEALAHMVEIERSQHRLMDAAETQRFELERELRLGTFNRIDSVHDLLVRAEQGADQEMLDRLLKVDEELLLARFELDELAHGLRPRALTEGGLGFALRALAERSSVPVAVEVQGGRLPTAVEAAIYFVCAEALTNVVKHAQASNASVVVEEDGSVVRATILDDGIGGVELTGPGSGLEGLAHRAEALGGSLSVNERSAGGTTVEVSIPLD